MSTLSELLYRTNNSVLNACEELEIEFDNEDLEDLEQCSHCNIWWKSYELSPDLDGNNLCKFCETYYGR